VNSKLAVCRLEHNPEVGSHLQQWDMTMSYKSLISQCGSSTFPSLDYSRCETHETAAKRGKLATPALQYLVPDA
jgi:hypothetical protein